MEFQACTVMTPECKEDAVLADKECKDLKPFNDHGMIVQEQNFQHIHNTYNLQD